MSIVPAQEVPAQSPSRASIVGEVVDRQSGVALPGVNVFLSHTMLGAATDSLGRFEINGVPFGRYELAVSMIGYESHVEEIALHEAGVSAFDFKLAPADYRLGSIEVAGEFNREWWNQLRKFERYFFSTTPNAAGCHILNPLILDFEEDAGGRVFRARADGPLVIENRSLGYRITLVLNAFEYDERSHAIRYVVVPWFEEMEPRNEKERSRFEQRRYRAYTGSLRHFLSMLVRDRNLPRQLFARRTGYYLSVAGTDSTFSPQATLLELVNSAPEEMAEYYMHHIELVTESEGGTFTLAFDKYLILRYTQESEAYEYIRFMERDGGVRQHQHSILRVLHPVEVDERGLLGDPSAVFVYGYMAWERLAEMLPFEYEPPAVPPKNKPWWRFWN